MAQDGRGQQVGAYWESFFYFKCLCMYVWMYVCMVALGLHYCTGFFLVVQSQLLIEVAPLVVEHRL